MRLRDSQIRSRLGALGVALVAVACTADVGDFRPRFVNQDQAVIYVYMNPSSLLNMLKSHQYAVLGKDKLGRIGPGLHYARHVYPGAHVLAVRDPINLEHVETGGSKLELTVEAGRNYYVRIVSQIDAANVITWVPEHVPEPIGRNEIRRTQPG